MKYLFRDDYSEGAHPELLEALMNFNIGQKDGYGLDDVTQLAVERIQKAFATDADVHFVTGGTQANLVCLASMLKPYEAVITAKTAHISEHEAGAIEATGHKVIEVETDNGKLTPQDIKKVVDSHIDEHMVMPRVVFISQSTELGTIYSKDELKAIIATAHGLGLYVYVDGARLAIAMTSPSNDLELQDLASLGVDMFYIGGTKNGAVLGEAIVIPNKELRSNFRWYLKQHGALLAKGRVVASQFVRFFDKDQFWLELGKQANDNAQLMITGLRGAGVEFVAEPTTNQIFVNLSNEVIKTLEKDYGFYVWNPVDDERSTVRLVTSWATDKDMINEFINNLLKMGR